MVRRRGGCGRLRLVRAGWLSRRAVRSERAARSGSAPRPGGRCRRRAGMIPRRRGSRPAGGRGAARKRCPGRGRAAGPWKWCTAITDSGEVALAAAAVTIAAVSSVSGQPAGGQRVVPTIDHAGVEHAPHPEVRHGRDLGHDRGAEPLQAGDGVLAAVTRRPSPGRRAPSRLSSARPYSRAARMAAVTSWLSAQRAIRVCRPCRAPVGFLCALTGARHRRRVRRFR